MINWAGYRYVSSSRSQTFTEVCLGRRDGGPIGPMGGMEQFRQVRSHGRFEAFDVVFQVGCTDFY